MMKKLLIAFPLLFSPVLLSAGGLDPVTEAQQALKPFKMELMKALKAGMKSGGPLEAINVCKTRAPEIARQQGNELVQLGRSSHKLRNPDNAPAGWMKPLIAEYANAGDKLPPKTVKLPSGKTGYVEPIYTKAVCLGCHGNQLQPALAEKLTNLYPQDQATGFTLGEFRGIFWAVVSE